MSLAPGVRDQGSGSRAIMKTLTSVLLASLLFSSSQSWAQELPLSQEQIDRRYEELVLWLKKYRHWEKWIARYGNRPAETLLGNVDSDRVKRPEPPVWLSEDCENFIAYEGKLGEACEILRKWQGLAWHLQQLKDDPVLTTTGGIVNDRVVKSSFWQKIHLTGLWTPGQVPPPPMYGIIGMQVGVVEIGRVTFPALGVMLVMLTNDNGDREWKPATNISVSFRLRSFEIYRNTAALHFNVSRLNIHAMDTGGSADFPVNLNFIGLSLSFKKGHQ
jgi:hypothetical protein